MVMHLIFEVCLGLHARVLVHVLDEEFLGHFSNASGSSDGVFDVAHGLVEVCNLDALTFHVLALVVVQG